MVEKAKAMEAVKELFDGWQETIIWSCLQGVMGDIYVNHDGGSPETERPVVSEKQRAAMALLGDFCFFAGMPDRDLVLHPRKMGGREFLIMVPQHEGWSHMIEEGYGKKAKAVSRYAFHKDMDAFDKEQLAKLAGSLGPDYEMELMGRELFEQCRAEGWSRDLVGQFAGYEDYEKKGIGVAILKDGALIAGASSYSRYKEGIEIEIDTKEEFRRRGLALACGARLILECLARGLYPSWDAQNPGSAALAKKLGYRPAGEYRAYEVLL